MRRLFTLLTTAALAVGLFSPTAASAAKPGDLELRTAEAPALLPGQSAWVNVMWRAKGAPVTDVVVTVRGEQVGTSYPSGRDHTSFTDGRELGSEMMDFTAVKVDMPTTATKRRKLKLRVEYVSEGQRVVKDNLTVEIPVREAGGDPWVRQTDTLPVKAGSPAWVHVFFEGVQANDGFNLTATAPAGATVHYPEGRSDTSLQGDAELAPGEQDYVALLIDPADLTPGEYDLPVTVSSSTGRVQQTLRIRVS